MVKEHPAKIALQVIYRASPSRGHHVFPLCSSVTGTSNPSTEVREAPKWFIRPAEAQEAKPVAEVMARAFHRPARLKYLDGAAFKIFQAEVMDSMIAKLHLSDSSCFACLVAQTEDESLCGAVEVSQQDHPQVLQILQSLGFQDSAYVYISGMAVRQDFRRQGLGSDLLIAAELLSETWAELDKVLHVHTDNPSAIEFYICNGYTEIHREANFPLRRPRVLLIKQCKRNLGR